MNPSNVLRVARRELRSIFGSPIGYIVAVLFLSLTGWLLFPTFFLQGRGDLRAFFELLPIILALVVPAITMRQLSEELSSGTFELVLTLPLSAAEILFGKFLGARGFLVAVLLPTLAYPISVSSVTRLDWGPVAGGYLGAFLLLGLYCAVGLLASSASRNQIVAFVLSLSACAFLALVDRVLFLIPAVLVAPLQFMSATVHVENVRQQVEQLLQPAPALAVDHRLQLPVVTAQRPQPFSRPHQLRVHRRDQLRDTTGIRLLHLSAASRIIGFLRPTPHAAGDGIAAARRALHTLGSCSSRPVKTGGMRGDCPFASWPAGRARRVDSH